MKLKPAEELVLESIHLDQPSSFMIQRYAINYASLYGLPIPSVSELERAIESLLKRKFIHIVNRSFLHRMKTQLICSDIHGPILGWPAIGSIGLTRDGFEYLQKRNTERTAKSNKANYLLSEHSIPVEWHGQLFALSLRAIESITINYELQHFMVLHEPQKCAAWQHVPWNTFLSGYQVEFVETYSAYTSTNYLRLRKQAVGIDLFKFFDEFILAVYPRYLHKGKVIKKELRLDSFAEIICLAFLAGLFGQGGDMTQSCLAESLGNIFRELPGKFSYDSNVIVNRVLSQKWARTTQMTDVELVNQVEFHSPKCISFVDMPVVGKTISLTETGFGILTKALDILWGNDKWNEHILGVRSIDELRYLYYEDYETALKAMEHRAQSEGAIAQDWRTPEE